MSPVPNLWLIVVPHEKLSSTAAKPFGLGGHVHKVISSLKQYWLYVVCANFLCCSDKCSYLND